MTYVGHSNGLINTLERHNSISQIHRLALWVEERSLDSEVLARRPLADKMVEEVYGLLIIALSRFHTRYLLRLSKTASLKEVCPRSHASITAKFTTLVGRTNRRNAFGFLSGSFGRPYSASRSTMKFAPSCFFKDLFMFS